MFSRGIAPQKRLSSELSRLSPIPKKESGGTGNGPNWSRRRAMSGTLGLSGYVSGSMCWIEARSSGLSLT